jgi:hypothetical protein
MRVPASSECIFPFSLKPIFLQSLRPAKAGDGNRPGRDVPELGTTSAYLLLPVPTPAWFARA